LSASDQFGDCRQALVVFAIELIKAIRENGDFVLLTRKIAQQRCAGQHGIRRFKDVPWLSLTPVEAVAAIPVLHSRRTNSLSLELSRRWTGRRFDEVKILTGSTDESGAFLRWAHATFGITRATVALTPSSASFVAESLADLPLELRLLDAPPGRPLHAKFYWFDGAEGECGHEICWVVGQVA
jgi:hypothetical protein